MDLFNRQLDLGLDLDYDKEEQEETEFKERLNVYKLKYAKKNLKLSNIVVLYYNRSMF